MPMNELTEWIVAELRRGCSLVAIGAALGISDTAVQDALIDTILARVVEGESQASIAKDLGRSAGTISLWLSRDEATAKRSAQARSDSAEAWLDKGLDVAYEAITDPSYKGQGMDSSAVRTYVQECARRAAIRNPAYREARDAKVELNARVAATTKAVTLAATMTPEQAATAYRDLIG